MRDQYRFLRKSRWSCPDLINSIFLIKYLGVNFHTKDQLLGCTISQECLEDIRVKDAQE